ncbi:MAG: hypothetical protein WKG06_10925 [Segetibacter sp.]
MKGKKLEGLERQMIDNNKYNDPAEKEAEQNKLYKVQMAIAVRSKPLNSFILSVRD